MQYSEKHNPDGTTTKSFGFCDHPIDFSEIEETLNPINQLTLTQIEQIMEWAFVLGDPDANITILKYMALQCPFCWFISSTKVVEKALEKHSDSVNYISKNKMLQNGMNRWKLGAEAMQYVGAVTWTAQYYQLRDILQKRFIDWLWQTPDEAIKTLKSKNFTRKMFSDDEVKQIIKSCVEEIWLDTESTMAAIESWQFFKIIEKESKECEDIFAQTSVPATFVLNNKTGKYIKLESVWWKIPLESIEESVKLVS